MAWLLWIYRHNYAVDIIARELDMPAFRGRNRSISRDRYIGNLIFCIVNGSGNRLLLLQIIQVFFQVKCLSRIMMLCGRPT